MSEVYAARRDRLRDRCAAAGSAAALISRPANVRYLTGCAPPGAALLLGPPRTCCSADPAERGPRRGPARRGVRVQRAAQRAAATPPWPRPTWPPAGARHPGRRGAPPHRHPAPGARPGRPAAAPRATSACAVEQQRLVKDDEEIACLRIAAEIADQALGELLESILVGRTERHLALELERRLVDHGADGPAFPTSVATGPNSGRPGHRPTDRRVEEGDFLSVCLGANYRGYRCEIGRTFVIGTTPADWQIELYDLVFAAQRAGREALAPGAAYRDVDRAARHVLDAAGYGEGLAPLDRTRCGARNRRGPAVGACGHG